VVKCKGVVQGLLIPYIEGDNLWEARIRSEAELVGMTYRIIEIAAGLEKVGYYDEDLKCQNIVRRRSDGALFFIDFAGGLTEGFYREKSFDDLVMGKINGKDAIYILGKTLWQLWTLEHPREEDKLPDRIPEAARKIIYDCCIATTHNTIEELGRKHGCLK